MSTLFRIYTEDQGQVEKIIPLIEEEGFHGATLIHTIGVWGGQVERGLIIEIVSDTEDAVFRIRNIAGRIKTVFVQDTVLVTEQEVVSYLV